MRTPSHAPRAERLPGEETWVCAATRGELECFPFEAAGSGFRPLLTGIGIGSTALVLGSALSGERPARLLSIGIAGAYAGCGWSVGDTAVVAFETFGDLGMELPPSDRSDTGGDPAFLPLAEAAFAMGTSPHPPQARYPLETRAFGGHWREVGACTVNACTGTSATGAMRRRWTGAELETMEGAAVALAGKAFGVPVLEIRSVSNIAADRNISAEGIARALQALREALAQWVAGGARGAA